MLIQLAKQLRSFNALLILVAAFMITACNIFDSDSSDNNSEAPLETGLQTLESSDVEREYYLQLPSDDDGGGIAAAAIGDEHLKPLLFAYHGYTGSYQNWIGDNPFYDLVEVVGDDAIIVVPNGLPDAAGKRVWGGERDFNFFVDMLAEFDRRGLQYNPNKIFVAGHSNGAGFSHELGCKYGDVIRAIVTAAGALISTDCVGSIAVFMMHGSNDPLTTGTLAAGAHNYWVLYNGWDTNAFVDAEVGPCDDHSFPGELNSDYPVLWCEHIQGHSWPDFGSQSAWDFLTGLEEVAPTLDAPDGGGAERATPPSDANMTFRLDVPLDMNRPIRGVLTLRPLSYVDNKTCTAPDFILGLAFPLTEDQLIPGQISGEITVPITYFTFSGPALEFPSEHALAVAVYVEGGSQATIPTPGVDHEAAIAITLVQRDLDIILDQPLVLEPVIDVCGFGG